ncbi:MAG: hypothetical protein ABIP61_04385 [Burkholderiaceae bacterium]
MKQIRSALAPALALALLTTFCLPPAQAASAKAKSAHKASRQAAPKPAEVEPEPASPAQIEASDKVYLGAYACEFNQTVEIAGDPTHRGYIDVKHGKSAYLMKPVLSPTGAVRLEDVRGEGLLVQIASKSMLLNVKTGQRMVDNCVGAKQLELIEAARVAKAAQTGAAPATPLLLAPNTQTTTASTR